MPQPRRLPFVQFDVFTSHPLQGNPLAVFPDVRGLAEDECRPLRAGENVTNVRVGGEAVEVLRGELTF